MQRPAMNIALFGFMLMCVSLSACATIKMKYELSRAKHNDDILQLEQICDRYPGTGACDEAKSMILDKLDTVEALTQRIDTCDAPKWCSMLTEKRCDKYFEAAEIERTIEAYQQYLLHCPEGKSVDDARAAILEMLDTVEALTQHIKACDDPEWCSLLIEKRCDKYFEKAGSERTIEAYQHYLLRCPDGKSVEDAEWRIALKTDRIKTFRRFIHRYPESGYRQDAENRILFLQAKKCNSIEPLLRFYENRFYSQTTAAEEKQLLTCLKKLSRRRRSPPGLIRLFLETDNRDYLLEARKVSARVTTHSDEALLAKEFPGDYIKLDKWKIYREEIARKDKSGSEYVKHTYQGEIRSTAKFNTYRIQVKLSLPLVGKQVTGTIIRKTETIHKSIESRMVLDLPPKSRERIKVDFGPYARREVKKRLLRDHLTVWNIAGSPQYSIVVLNGQAGADIQ